jgi:hypothetical protein
VIRKFFPAWRNVPSLESFRRVHPNLLAMASSDLVCDPGLHTKSRIEALLIFTINKSVAPAIVLQA